MRSDSTNIFVVDTSALVTMQRYYPKQFLPDLWKELQTAFTNQRIVSHEFVYDEIVPKQGKKDDLAVLVADHKPAFQSITKRQAQLVPQIISEFPGLIDPRSKKDQADPWIIAMVVELMENVNLFENESDFVVVSTESPRSPNKIPAVCARYGARHMNLFEFFDDNNWQFRLSGNRE